MWFMFVITVRYIDVQDDNKAPECDGQDISDLKNIKFQNIAICPKILIIFEIQ